MILVGCREIFQKSACGQWKFNEGAGNVITDQTGHGNDITGSGDPTWVKVEIPKIN